MAGEILKRTHTSTGSTKKFTYSVWFKSNIQFTSNSYLFALGPDGLNQDDSRLYVSGASPNKLTYTATDVGISGVITDDGIRDTGSWYNFIVVVDTTISHPDDRVKLYINGVRKDVSYTTTAAQNANISHNTAGEILLLGSYRENSANFSAQGYYTDIFNVDGQALTPDVFGFYKDGDGYQSSGTTQATDFRPGQWVPKSPSVIKNVINNNGGFGVNGFYLPMNDSSNPGADFHCDPNSIITLKGEDLPQPRNGAPATTDAYVSQLRSDANAANLVLAVPGIALENTNTELVTNGTFNSNITGWTGYNSTPTWDSLNQRLEINASTEYDGAETSSGVSVSASTNYTLEVDVNLGTAGGVRLQVRDSTNASSLSNLDVSGSGTYAVNFASGSNTSVYIRLITSGGNSGTAYFDNVSMKEAVAVRDYSADIKGSGTNKTLTAAGNAGVGYELGGYYGSAMTFVNDGTNGSGNTDVINVPDSNDFYFTGDVTMEGWIYPTGTPSTAAIIFGQWLSGGGTDRNFNINFDTSRRLTAYFNSSATNYNTGTSPVLALNQWYHVAAEKYGSVFTLYVNGVAVGVNANTPTAGNNSTVPFTIGSETDGSNGADYGFNGQIQDVRVYKGVAKYKGGFDVPKPYTPVGIESWRETTDTCSNNFATLNPLLITPNSTLSDGNLSVNGNMTSGYTQSSTIAVSSGKWYCEMRATQISNMYFGIVANITGGLTSDSIVYNDALRLRMNGDFFIWLDGSSSPTQSFSSGYSAGDIVAVAFDVDAGIATWYVNGTSVGSYSTGISGKTWGVTLYANVSSKASINFGQNPTFSGQVTAGTNADDSGKGLFKYAPPTGFLALCEDNLPTPAIADPGDYFKTVLWTGSGGSKAITGVGFQPDLVWLKSRTNNASHRLSDSVRGVNKQLMSNTTEIEATFTTMMTSFDSDGFTLGDNAGINGSGYTNLAWCWKAGGAAVSNTDGTITSQVSANQTAGFSIVKFTGQTSGTGTVGHGLGKKPAFWIYKPINNTTNWYMYHQSLGASAWLNFTTSAATTGNAAAWGGVEPTSTVLTHGSGLINQGSCILYAWAEIEGFSKFGSYIGNANDDGPFVYCGFKPAWVMIKITTGTNSWVMYDSSRNSTNIVNNRLRADLSNIEDTHNGVDFLSNGFKLRDAGSSSTNAAQTYIFMAFAESPFQTANSK